MRRRMSGGKKLLAVFMAYGGLAVLVTSLNVVPFTYGLSTVMGTSLFASSTPASSMVSSLVAGVNVIASFSTALLEAQVVVTLLAILLLSFAEVTNPAYGKTGEVVAGLRRSWMPILVFLMVLFAVTILSKMIVLLQ